MKLILIFFIRREIIGTGLLSCHIKKLNIFKIFTSVTFTPSAIASFINLIAESWDNKFKLYLALEKEMLATVNKNI